MPWAASPHPTPKQEGLDRARDRTLPGDERTAVIGRIVMEHLDTGIALLEELAADPEEASSVRERAREQLAALDEAGALPTGATTAEERSVWGAVGRDRTLAAEERLEAMRQLIRADPGAGKALLLAITSDPDEDDAVLVGAGRLLAHLCWAGGVSEWDVRDMVEPSSSAFDEWAPADEPR